MVLTLLIPLRSIFKLQDIITMRHIDLMCKVTLATGSIVGYAYTMEFFIAWYSGNPNEQFHFLNRALGPYQWAWIPMVTCNVLVPQLFWFRSLRQNLVVVFIISILVNVGHVVRAVRHHRGLACTAISCRRAGAITIRPGSISALMSAPSGCSSPCSCCSSGFCR